MGATGSWDSELATSPRKAFSFAMRGGLKLVWACAKCENAAGGDMVLGAEGAGGDVEVWFFVSAEVVAFC